MKIFDIYISRDEQLKHNNKGIEMNLLINNKVYRWM